MTTIAGTAGVTGHADGTGPAASFYGIYSARRTLRETSTSRTASTTLSGNAPRPGSSHRPSRKLRRFGKRRRHGTAATFSTPAGRRDETRPATSYVSDIGNHNIRKITPAGVVHDPRRRLQQLGEHRRDRDPRPPSTLPAESPWTPRGNDLRGGLRDNALIRKDHARRRRPTPGRKKRARATSTGRPPRQCSPSLAASA